MTVTDTLPIEEVDAYVLSDMGSTHSFLSLRFASRLGVKPRKLETPLIVSSPLECSWEVEVYYPVCIVMIQGHRLPADLILLDMEDFDATLGMGWLFHYHAFLIC